MSHSLAPSLDAPRVASPTIAAHASRATLGETHVDPSTTNAVPATRAELGYQAELRYAGYRSTTLRFELLGAAHLPLVVVQGGISACSHVAASSDHAGRGWWDAQVGPGRAIDTTRHRVLSIDWLGSDGDIDAPIDTADQADAIACVLDALGVVRVAAFVGASYGAMVGLAFATRYPHRLDRLVAISGAHRAHPAATAVRLVQRRIAALGGDDLAKRREALAVARQLAMLTYRTDDELAERFAATPARVDDGFRFACEGWLSACGAGFVERVHPVAFTRLSESIDLHRVEPARVAAPTTLVAIREDRLVPHADIEALAREIGPRATIVSLSSRYGHDAFLKGIDAIERVLAEVLR